MENPNVVFTIGGACVAVAGVIMWYVVNLAITDLFPQLSSMGWLIAIPVTIIIIGVVIGFVAATIQ